MALKGINHVVLKIRNLERSRKFYELLGFSQSGQRNGMLFFHGGAHAHDLALFELGERAQLPGRSTVGMMHFCVTVPDEQELARLYHLLVEAGHEVISTVDHIVSRSLYTKDPDGNVVEVTVDMPESDWAHLENPFAIDKPYELSKAKS